TLWALIGLSVTLFAASVAAYQAANARAERRAVESLRKDIGVVAANVTKMAFVLADGSNRFGGMSDFHLAAIRRYEEAMRVYLPPDGDADIAKILRERDDQIRRSNEKK